MGLLGQGLLPGHDWLALFTPSERPGPSSVPPSRHHALVLGLIGLVHRRASRLAAIAARPRPASTRTALEVSICCLSICCPGLVCWQHFPLATDPTVASNPESRSTAIIVLHCVLGLTGTLVHAALSLLVQSFTLLLAWVYTPRCIFPLYSGLLCIHTTTTLPLGAVVPRRQGPELPIRFVYCPHKTGNETRRRNPPCASTCSIEPGCPHALLSQPGRKPCRVPREAATTRRSDPACLHCPRLKVFRPSQPSTRTTTRTRLLRPVPAASLADGSTPSTEHRALRTEHRAQHHTETSRANGGCPSPRIVPCRPRSQ